MTAAPLRQQRVEQPELGVEIVLDASDDSPGGRGQIGEAAGGEADAVEPALVEAVAGGLHRGMGDPVAGEIRASSCMQRDRVGRRQAAVRRSSRRPRRRSCRCSPPLSPARSQICRAKAATEVLPLVPVTATIVRGWRAKKRAAAARAPAADRRRG